MSETRILLIRHAETAAPGQFHGAESDVGLGSRGFEQAEAAAPSIAATGPTAVYCSGMLRARQTAEPIGQACGLTPIVVVDIHERRMGPLSGMTLADGWESYIDAMARWKLGDLDATHEGGESFAQIRDRVVPAFSRIAGEHSGETVVIVAHGIVIRVLLCSLLEGYGTKDFDGFGIDFVAVNDLRFDGQAWRPTILNGVALR